MLFGHIPGTSNNGDDDDNGAAEGDSSKMDRSRFHSEFADTPAGAERKIVSVR